MAPNKQVNAEDEDETPITFLDLTDDCLWHILGFLPLKDLASMELTCSRLEGLAVRVMKLKKKKISVQVKDHVGLSGAAVDRDSMVKRFSVLSNLEIDFNDVSNHFESCETIFKYLYEYRSHPMEKLEVLALNLPDGMPPSMGRFFVKISVGEVHFKGCNLGPNYAKPALEFTLQNVLCMRFTGIHSGFVCLDVFTAPHIQTLVIESTQLLMVGVTRFLENHAEIREIEVERCSDVRDLISVLNSKDIDGFRWFSWEIKGQHYDLQIRAPSLESYFRNILHFKVDYVKRIIYEQSSMKSLARREGLHKLQLNAGDIYWSDVFEPLTSRIAFENYLLQLVEESATLNEIELGFLDHRHVYRFSRDAYERFLAISKERNRKLTITFNFPRKFRLPWPITRKFGINADYLRQNEKYVEIIIKFEAGTNVRERDRARTSRIPTEYVNC